MLCHFDECFLLVPDRRGHPLGKFKTPWDQKDENSIILKNGSAVWESLDTFLDDAQYTPSQWWRIKDLFIQFYSLREAAEVFRYGGHCTNIGRVPEETNQTMADSINKQIENVVIPQIRKALNKENNEENSSQN